MQLAMDVIKILAVVCVVIDHTTTGTGDSDRVMTYEIPVDLNKYAEIF